MAHESWFLMPAITHHWETDGIRHLDKPQVSEDIMSWDEACSRYPKKARDLLDAMYSVLDRESHNA